MRPLSTFLLLGIIGCVPRPDERPSQRPSAPVVQQPTVPPTPPVPVPEPRPLVLAVGGDVTLGYHHEEWFDEQVQKGRSREEMFAYGFKNVRPLVPDEELFVVNLECPFTARGEKVPKNFNFRARPEFVATLVAGGVDAVSLANNHLMDYGLEGLLDTMAVLDEQGIPYFGAGRNLAEARRPAIIEWQGMKVALLGYFFLGTRNIEPPVVIATETTPGVAGHFSDVDQMERMLREDITLARTQADLVVPFFHWGRERYFLPEPYQARLGRAAVEAGASLVLGSHPHVLQGMELFNGVPIAYSLGNFVFGGNWNPQPKHTALFKARFSRAGYLSSEIIPLLSDAYPLLPAQPQTVDEGQGAEILRLIALYSSLFETPLPELPAPPPEYRVEPPPVTAAR